VIRAAVALHGEAARLSDDEVDAFAADFPLRDDVVAACLDPAEDPLLKQRVERLAPLVG
jgi:hypothetical protein